MPVVGLLDPRSHDAMADRLRAFRLGLKDVGYVEGENVTIIYRFAEDQFDRLPELAAELVRRRVTVIAASATPAAIAAKPATTTIPIAFIVAEDPVRLGLVASLARPGGNLTGINFFGSELTAKRLDLLRELLPRAARVAVLVSPADATNTAFGVHMTHVPYRGSGPMLNDLVGGQVQFAFDGIASSIGHIRSGRLRALGIGNATRVDGLPDVPAVAEFLPGYEASGIQGLGAPRNTPVEIIDKLNREINTALADPKIKAQLADLGSPALAGSPADFGKHIADETEKWAKVIKFAGIKAE